MAHLAGAAGFGGQLRKTERGKEIYAMRKETVERVFGDAKEKHAMADRFVLTLINNRMVSSSDFEQTESGAVFLKDEARRAFLRAWQSKKQEEITHPYLKEKLPWGLVPYVQALLLARYLRGHLDGYPPFLWK